MMRILIDTNVLLDVLLSRDPWVTDAARLWAIIETGKVAGYVCASTFTDIFYVARRLIPVVSPVDFLASIAE